MWKGIRSARMADEVLGGKPVTSTQSDGSTVFRRQKVAVIGAGAVGLYYGSRLREVGHDVSFLARRDLEAMRRGGLTISSPDGDMRITPEDIKVFSRCFFQPHAP